MAYNIALFENQQAATAPFVGLEYPDLQDLVSWIVLYNLGQLIQKQVENNDPRSTLEALVGKNREKATLLTAEDVAMIIAKLPPCGIIGINNNPIAQVVEKVQDALRANGLLAALSLLGITVASVPPDAGNVPSICLIPG